MAKRLNIRDIMPQLLTSAQPRKARVIAQWTAREEDGDSGVARGEPRPHRARARHRAAAHRGHRRPARHQHDVALLGVIAIGLSNHRRRDAAPGVPDVRAPTTRPPAAVSPAAARPPPQDCLECVELGFEARHQRPADHGHITKRTQYATLAASC